MCIYLNLMILIKIIRGFISALYRQRRCKSPGDESETLTRRNDAIFGNHVWQTFAQYFPPGLEKPSV
ncbi:hypothetical protein N7V12_003111 [Escherichia coli]|nr:hypothetical protein [Escherichia coli]